MAEEGYIATLLAGYTLFSLPALYFTATTRAPQRGLGASSCLVAYFLGTKPLQLWLLVADPFRDDARHLWALSIEVVVLLIVLRRAGAGAGRVALGTLGVVIAGIVGFFVAGALDPFDLRSGFK